MCTKSHGTVILIDKFLAQFGLRHAGVVLITMTPPTLRPHTCSMQSVLYAMHSCMYIRIGVGNIWLVKIPSYTPPPLPLHNSRFLQKTALYYTPTGRPYTHLLHSPFDISILATIILQISSKKPQ